jgi:hypothetical protein
MGGEQPTSADIGELLTQERLGPDLGSVVVPECETQDVLRAEQVSALAEAGPLSQRISAPRLMPFGESGYLAYGHRICWAPGMFYPIAAFRPKLCRWKTY